MGDVVDRWQRLGEFQRRLLSLRLGVGNPNAVEDKRLVAYLVPRSAAIPDPTVLRRFLARRLPAYMVPTTLMSLPALPLTSSGKVDRSRLQTAGRVVSGGEREVLAPRNEAEKKIAAIWAEILTVDKVGAEDNFFDLGGHSLLMVRLQSRLKEALGTEIAIIDLFRFPTVRSCARFVTGLAPDSSAASHDSDGASTVEQRIRNQREAVAEQRRLREDRRAKHG